MAKQKKQQQTVQAVVVEKPKVTATTTAVQFPPFVPYLIIFVFSFAIYANTLWNKYAIDDTIVVTDNTYTKKGFGGIKDHFTHDMFEGFFGERGAKLVSGGRYRPLSMVTLSIEYELVRKARGDKREIIDDKNIIMTDNDPYLNPFLSHLINILLFAATCLVLYIVLLQMFPAKKDKPFFIGIPFIVAMLYAAHPIHTEAVANIKGRDEIMCMLFSLLALYAAIRYVRTQNVAHIVWGTLIYFVALLSKENAVTFFAVIPLTFYFFTKAKVRDYVVTVGAYLVPFAVFLALRSAYTQAGITQDSPEILNNPFLLATGSQRFATSVLTFLYYFKLLVFPHPLTHDYYFNQIPYVDAGNGLFVLSFVLNAALVMYALLNFKKKSVPAYGILFYFITFSVVSNLLFTVGVLMNERFIYMSSLGFCIVLAYLIVHYIKSPKVAMGVLVLILSLYSVKTYTRNTDWMDSFTLFRRDVAHSPNSAKIQTSVGGDLTKAASANITLFRDSGVIKTIFDDLSQGKKSEAELNAIVNLPDSMIVRLLLDSSIYHLREAVRIYPTHSNAWLLMGNAMYKRDHKAEDVIPIYEKAAAYRVGGYYDAYFNLGVVYNDANNGAKAKDNLLKALEMKPEQMEIRYLLAQAYAKINQPDSTAYWLQRGNELKKIEAHDYYQVGTSFGKVGGNLPVAIEYLKKAVELNPKVELYWEDLGVAYGLNGRFDEAIAASEKLIELNPKYPAAYMNLSVSYRNKGNTKLADEYLKKYQEVTGK
ncbi:MAG: tetratricopeptide repeat protein [Chitinophagales bacterium]|nr:tetratricopeptide repeat protein [Chitinophagales bacterium]